MADQSAEWTKPTPRLAGILWGGPKTGKTTYAASSPGQKFLLNLDIEGWTSLNHRDDVTINDLSDKSPSELIDYFMKDAAAKWIMDQPIQPGDTILMDSMTVLNQAGVIVAVARDIGGGKGFKPTLEAPGLGAYGARGQYITYAMNSVNRAARRKQAHIWFIAHEDTPERNEKGEFLYQSILLSDKSINNASGAISEIWRMSEYDNARTVMIRSTSKYKPMGTRLFRTEEKKEFKLKYDIEKPDLSQPMAIASLWDQYRSCNYQKLHVPE